MTLKWMYMCIFVGIKWPRVFSRWMVVDKCTLFICLQQPLWHKTLRLEVELFNAHLFYAIGDSRLQPTGCHRIYCWKMWSFHNATWFFLFTVLYFTILLLPILSQPIWCWNNNILGKRCQYECYWILSPWRRRFTRSHGFKYAGYGFSDPAWRNLLTQS